MGKQLIIIEDSLTDQKVLNHFIMKSNYFENVCFFNNGLDAIHYLTKLKSQDLINTVKAIITDINMPVLNGFEFCDKLNDMFGLSKLEIPVFFLSSSHHEEDIIKAQTYNFYRGFINKPINQEILDHQFLGLISE